MTEPTSSTPLPSLLRLPTVDEMARARALLTESDQAMRGAVTSPNWPALVGRMHQTLSTFVWLHDTDVAA